MAGNDGLPYIAVYSRGIVQGKQDRQNIAAVDFSGYSGIKYDGLYFVDFRH